MICQCPLNELSFAGLNKFELNLIFLGHNYGKSPQSILTGPHQLLRNELTFFSGLGNVRGMMLRIISCFSPDLIFQVQC
jgi:hypothetical protein